MKTKIGLFCEQIIEVGWLLALIIAPLFFNVYSSRVFEPDKLSLVRTIATFMLAAAFAHWLEGRRSANVGPRQDAAEAGALSAIPLVGKAALFRIPLVVPTLLLALAYLLSTTTSVVPRTSLWGSYQRLQGTYSTLSYMVIFALLLRYLRRHAQLQRLLFVVILTSVPISLYGLLQHYGLDPLPWGGDVTLRVASNMGNPIFVAAYVILVIPLTLAQILYNLDRALQECDRASRLVVYGVFGAVILLIVWTWAALGFGRGLLIGVLGLLLFLLMGVYLRRPLAPFLLFGGYGLALAAQVTMLFFSQSRGPFLGIVAGLFFFALLIAFIHRWRKALALGIAGALLVLSFLVVVNLPASPLRGFRQLPYVGRLGQVFEIGGGTGKVRVLIWQGAVEMIRADPLRALIGYGPESMYVAYNPYYPPELAHYEARNASPDRSHNETFDALITAGAAGLLLYLLLFGSTLYYGLRWLGLIRSPQQRRFFVVCAMGGLLLGLAAPILLDGGNWRFVGVGLPMGLVAGLSVYLALSALRATWGTVGSRPSADRMAI
ncbi:MAG: O-antigen ligase family protein, partial [Chloroflexi bacterium]|nr:O-antigen ligase family protein [Chloroflexota bacterium]